MELQLLLVPARSQRAAAQLEHNLGDRAPIQVAPLDLGDRDPLHQVVEKLDRLVLFIQGRMAEHADSIERQRRRPADGAAHAPTALVRVQRAQSVYLVMIWSSRRFSDWYNGQSSKLRTQIGGLSVSAYLRFDRWSTWQSNRYTRKNMR